MRQPPVIEHDRAAYRFETRVAGFCCVLDYTLADDLMTITHTGVPAAVAGRGIASALMQAAVSAASREGWRIVPACSFASAWMRRHRPRRDLHA